jgi:hypothetical protein
VNDEGWEARMSARAAQRRAAAEVHERAAHDALQQHYEQRVAAAYSASMMLGEAAVWLDYPFACACIGGPLCCRYRTVQALNLRRAAHIVVKLVDGLRSP